MLGARALVCAHSRMRFKDEKAARCLSKTAVALLLVYVAAWERDWFAVEDYQGVSTSAGLKRNTEISSICFCRTGIGPSGLPALRPQTRACVGGPGGSRLEGRSGAVAFMDGSSQGRFWAARRVEPRSFTPGREEAAVSMNPLHGHLGRRSGSASSRARDPNLFSRTLPPGAAWRISHAAKTSWRPKGAGKTCGGVSKVAAQAALSGTHGRSIARELGGDGLVVLDLWPQGSHPGAVAHCFKWTNSKAFVLPHLRFPVDASGGAIFARTKTYGTPLCRGKQPSSSQDHSRTRSGERRRAVLMLKLMPSASVPIRGRRADGAPNQRSPKFEHRQITGVRTELEQEYETQVGSEKQQPFKGWRAQVKNTQQLLGLDPGGTTSRVCEGSANTGP